MFYLSHILTIFITNINSLNASLMAVYINWINERNLVWIHILQILCNLNSSLLDNLKIKYGNDLYVLLHANGNFWICIFGGIPLQKKVGLLFFKQRPEIRDILLHHKKWKANPTWLILSQMFSKSFQLWYII